MTSCSDDEFGQPVQLQRILSLHPNHQQHFLTGDRIPPHSAKLGVAGV